MSMKAGSKRSACAVEGSLRDSDSDGAYAGQHRHGLQARPSHRSGASG
jgi:hypothetical protein